MNANEEFELIGELYYRRFHRLRPGKSEAPESYRDSMDDDNIRQFSDWIKHECQTDALAEVARLTARNKQLEEFANWAGYCNDMDLHAECRSRARATINSTADASAGQS